MQLPWWFGGAAAAFAASAEMERVAPSVLSGIANAFMAAENNSRFGPVPSAERIRAMHDRDRENSAEVDAIREKYLMGQ